jgi:hypothetical protein
MQKLCEFCVECGAPLTARRLTSTRCKVCNGRLGQRLRWMRHRVIQAREKAQQRLANEE